MLLVDFTVRKFLVAVGTAEHPSGHWYISLDFFEEGLEETWAWDFYTTIVPSLKQYSKQCKI